MNEKEAIEILIELSTFDYVKLENGDKAIETVLDLIQTQQAEIEKKDKIIDLMAKELVKAHKWFYSEFDNYTKEDFIKYFERKVENGN